ncbi:MAG TPA: RNA polymerase sigma factor RpoE [Salinisphaeraceae bacterium]|nr:RNA polymerase sigma factor RpoE [Salinisphaeraceae bacterium]
MSEDASDAQLVARAQAGDDRAFELLVRKYQHKVMKLTARYVNPADAPDVAQEAFIKAYRALGGFKGNSAFYTWLYRISINTAKNHLVARSRRPASQDIDVADAELYGHTERLSEVDTPEALLESEEIRDTVIQAIQSLPEDLRTAIMLRELEGMTYEEIAQTMDCPVGTVRSRIFRARAAIEQQLAALSDYAGIR